MSVAEIAALGISVVLVIYLVVALIFPERF